MSQKQGKGRQAPQALASLRRGWGLRRGPRAAGDRHGSGRKGAPKTGETGVLGKMTGLRADTKDGRRAAARSALGTARQETRAGGERRPSPPPRRASPPPPPPTQCVGLGSSAAEAGEEPDAALSGPGRPRLSCISRHAELGPVGAARGQPGSLA